MRYAIYPPIGIARLGDSLTDYFIGPEAPGAGGVESDGAGGEHPVQQFKHQGPGALLVKRQAARFRVFEDAQDGTPPRPAQLPAGARVEWTVHLVNKKAAVNRTGHPKSTPERPQLAANPQGLIIDPGPRTVAGAMAPSAKFDTGTYRGRTVPLGELRTDANQNLLVLGGHGFSSSPTNAPLTNFYNNFGWHDDASDGPVAARVIDANGATLIGGIESAWVIVAPPDFAPDIQGFVTLYDILFQVGADHLGLPVPARPSFTEHIFPILNRVSRLRWVNGHPVWKAMSTDWAGLADSSAAARPQREDAAQVVDDAVTYLSDFALTNAQAAMIQSWTVGNFTSDWTGGPPAPSFTAAGLTRAALEGTVGQGFYPGIEAGVIVKDATLYSSPFDFRINHGSVQPGDLTALMALPWQADFLACNRSWWPAQRPDDVLPNGTTTTAASWDRGIDSYDEMVKKFARLGFVVAASDPTGNPIFVEDQRAPDAVFL